MAAGLEAERDVVLLQVGIYVLDPFWGIGTRCRCVLYAHEMKVKDEDEVGDLGSGFEFLETSTLVFDFITFSFSSTPSPWSELLRSQELVKRVALTRLLASENLTAWWSACHKRSTKDPSIHHGPLLHPSSPCPRPSALSAFPPQLYTRSHHTL